MSLLSLKLNLNDYVNSSEFSLPHYQTYNNDFQDRNRGIRVNVDRYDMVTGLLNHFYPVRTITVTSRDPTYITPSIKAKLRSKNRMMRAGRIEKAN